MHAVMNGAVDLVVWAEDHTLAELCGEPRTGVVGAEWPAGQE